MFGFIKRFIPRSIRKQLQYQLGVTELRERIDRLEVQNQRLALQLQQSREQVIPSYIQLNDFTVLVDKLRLAVPTRKLWAHLKKVISPPDIEDLSVLLDFVADQAGNQPAEVIRASDLEPSSISLTRQRNILFITGQFPNDHHGGGGRLVDFIKAMSQEHNLYLYSVFVEQEDSATYHLLKPFCQKIKCVPPPDFSYNLAGVREFINNLPAIDIVHYEWPAALSVYHPSWGKYHLFTHMEAVSLRLLMDLDFEEPLSASWLNNMIQLLKMLKIELVDASPMDALIVVTQKDGEFLARLNPGASYLVLPHGANMADFCLPDVPPEKNTLVFVGHYGHYPNEDAVKFFCEEILGPIKAQVPDVKVWLVGADPTPLVRGYHDGRHIFVTGMVDDIRPYIQRASVCLAPLISGAGMRGKVTQYAALKRVCVATSIAATDLPFEEGRDIFIADDPILFAERVVYLLQHPEVAQQMAQAAYEKAQAYCDSQLLVKYLYRIYDRLDQLHQTADLVMDVKLPNTPDIFIFVGPGENQKRARLGSYSSENSEKRRVFCFSADSRFKNLSVIEELRRSQAVEEAVCFVEHPIWTEEVLTLQSRYGWKVVVDQVSFNKINNHNPDLALATEQLLKNGDLIITPELAQADTETQTGLWGRINNLYGEVSIIIVSYNNLKFTQQCIDSILTRTIYPNYKVIIVDNNSEEEVKTYLADLQQREPRVQVICNETNKGFAAANNIGLQLAKESEFVVLLNNDTVVPRGWLCRLLRHARQPEIGMVGPVTNWTGNEAKIEVDYVDISEMDSFARAYTQAHEGQIFDIKVLAMYCVAMRRTVVDEIGPLDEQFGTGMFEDEDYAMRVRQTGRRVVCAEDVFVHHYGRTSFSKLKNEEYQQLFERNKQLYEAKWGQWVPHQIRQ